ncbi:MAG: cobalamin biosynthesis protein [Pyrobaculum sp.]
MLSNLWLGVAVVYASEAGREGAERAVEALKKIGVAAAAFKYSELDEIWGCYDAYLFVMAAGGVVRALCPRLRAKGQDPAVVVTSHDLRYFVPLLGMHWGANELAEALAKALGGVAVITTAAEALGFAPVEAVERALLCSLAPEDRLEVYKRLTSGGEVCVEARLPAELPGYRSGGDCPVTIRVGCNGRLCCKPWRLYVGFGATSAASADEVVEAVRAVLSQIGAARVEAVASVKDLVYQVASAIGATAVRLDPSQLRGAKCLSPPVEAAVKALGVGNVAEAAALTAAGPGSWLVYRKRAFGGRVTVAVAANA